MLGKKDSPTTLAQQQLNKYSFNQFVNSHQEPWQGPNWANKKFWWGGMWAGSLCYQRYLQALGKGPIRGKSPVISHLLHHALNQERKFRFLWKLRNCTLISYIYLKDNLATSSANVTHQHPKGSDKRMNIIFLLSPRANTGQFKGFACQTSSSFGTKPDVGFIFTSFIKYSWSLSPHLQYFFLSFVSFSCSLGF